MAKQKHPHECAFCGALFAKPIDHMLHVTAHVPHQIQRGKMTRRKVSCWRCATEMAVPEEGQPYTCVCGFVLPPKAQFVEDEVTVETQKD